MNESYEQILRTVAELPDTFKFLEQQELQADLGIDSLGLIDLVVNLEEEFGIELSEDAMARVKTTGELWREIDKVTPA